jgi:hypothetical protein
LKSALNEFYAQTRLAAGLATILDAGSLKEYDQGLEPGEGYVGHVFELVPLPGEPPPACAAGEQDACGVCGGDGTSCGASALAEVRKTPSWPRRWAHFSLF